MIIGYNELRFNEATMMKIVEEYINGRILDVQEKIQVTGVNCINGSAGRDFQIIIQPATQGD